MTTLMYPETGTVPAEEAREIGAYAPVIVAGDPPIIVDWTVPAEFVVTNDTVIVCRAGITASHKADQ
jgi:hypothetical protein